MRSLKLSTKIYISLAIISIVAIVVGSVGIATLRSYKQVVDQMENASARAFLAEQVNGLILATVMESRGIYMSASRSDSEKFAVPLLSDLERLRAALENWRRLAPETGRARLVHVTAITEDFIRFRTELVRLSRDSSPAEARVFGDNDANRRVRAALNEEMSSLATELASEVGSLGRLVDDEYVSRSRLLIGLLIVGLAVGIGAAVHVVRSQITGPLGRITETMNLLAKGNYQLSIPHADSPDEIGTMAMAVQVFKGSLIEGDRLRSAQEVERARAERTRLEALQSMAEQVEAETGTAVELVAKQTGLMADNASKMAVSAGAVGENSQNVASAATQALSNAEGVAVATEQLSASIREIGGQIATATSVTAKAVLLADNAQNTIAQLSTAVNRIGEVANLISDIAAQTNLLALNATIEAARAGDAGKGFAVVANEVKHLANQTAKATEEITGQIAAVQSTTARAVSAVGEITKAIHDVEGVSTMVASAVEEQSAAAGEIARNVVETTRAAQDVAERIAVVSSEAQTTGERAADVSSVSVQVARSIDDLREILVRAVRTATTEVNRRRQPRFPVRRSGTLSHAGKTLPVTIENLSEGGLMGTELGEDIPAGSRLTVTIDGVAGSFGAAVVKSEKGRLHGRFELALEESRQWGENFRRLVENLAPLEESA